MNSDQRGGLLSQPPRKLVASATESFYKRLISRTACILRDGVVCIGVRLPITLFLP